MQKRYVSIRRAAWLAAAVGLVAGCQPEGKQTPPTGSASGQFAAGAPGDPLPSDLPRLLQTHVVNAFVFPVLDDAEPPRFTDMHQALLCADHSAVSVDGKPMLSGDLVPPGAFVLQWDMEMYCPFGVAGPLLHGRVEVFVARSGDQGFTATLRPVVLNVYEPSLPVDADVSQARAGYPAPSVVSTVATR